METSEKRYYELCRLCATYEARKLDIFSEQGKKKQLLKKIQSLLPFKVDEHDQMPRGLCYNCIYNLETAYNFRCKCIQATTNLEKCLHKIGENKKAKDETLNRLHRIRPEVSIFAIPNNVPKANDDDAINASSEESIPNPLDFLEVGVGEENMTRPNPPAKKYSGTNYKSFNRDVEKKWSSPGNAVTLFANDTRAKAHYYNVQNMDDGGLSRRKNLNPRKLARQRGGGGAGGDKGQKQNCFGNAAGTPPTPGLIAISIGAPSNCSTPIINYNRGSGNNRRSSSTVTSANHNNNSRRNMNMNNNCDTLSLNTPTMSTLESILSATEVKIEPEDCSVDDMIITPEITEFAAADEKENTHGEHSLLGPEAATTTVDSSSSNNNSSSKSFVCPLCQKVFTLKSSLNRHYLTAHQMSVEEQMMEHHLPQQHHHMPHHSILNPFAQQNDLFMDQFMTATNSSGMDTLSETVCCEVCNRIFHDRPSLWLHMVHAHREQASVSCGICLKVCCDNITLIEHVNTAHAGDTDVVQRRYSCQVCGRQHDSRQKLLKHATLHTLIDNQGQAIHPEEMILLNNAFAPRECNLCHKRFFGDEKLAHHVKTFHGEVNNPSGNCHSSHSGGASGASGGLVYKCELCLSSHANRMDRWWHMYHSHSGDARVTCEYKFCKKVFASQAIKDEHFANHHQLQGDYTNTCEVCGKLWESRVVFYKHMMNVHPKCLPSVCGVCLKIYSSVDELRCHVQVEHSPLDEKDGACCDVCGRFYGERSKMLRHRRVHNVTDDAPASYNATGGGGGGGNTAGRKKDDLQCSICPETEFKTMEEIAEHRRTVHQLFVCDLCPKFYNGNNHLWKHVSKQHRGNPDVTCDICLRTSASRAHLERHKLKYHADPLEKEGGTTATNNKPSSPTSQHIHKCHLCSKVFRIRSLLKKHLKTCKGARPRAPKVEPVNGVFPCGKCSKVFDYENTLYKHTKYAHIVHYCDICGKDVGFDAKKDLMTHIREQHAAHPDLECDVDGCRKLFRMKTDLHKHKLEHPRGYFSYMCEVCGDLYSNKKKLRKHLQTFHRDEVKFLCGICNLIYTSVDDLINHVQTSHSYVLRRPFTCQICGKGWSVTSKVVEHIGKFHGRQYKPCRICWKVFDDETKYQDHIDNHPPAPEKPPPPVRRLSDQPPKERTARSNVSKELTELGIMSSDGTLLKRTIEDDGNLLDDSNTKRLRKRFTCKHCKQSFRLTSELAEHMQTEHPGVASLTDAADDADDRDYHHYSRPKSSFKAAAATSSSSSAITAAGVDVDKKRKLWTDHQRIVCGCCRRVWNTKKQLWQHIIRSHSDESQFTCGICLRVCRNYDDLSYHLDARHMNYMKENFNRFACRVCGHYHNSQCKLEKHRNMHKNTLPFVQYACNYCDKLFKSKISFYEHINNKHRSRKNDFKLRLKKLYLVNENDANDPETRYVLLRDSEPDISSDEDTTENMANESQSVTMHKKALKIGDVADRNEGGGDVDMMDDIEEEDVVEDDDDEAEALIEEEQEEEDEDDELEQDEDELEQDPQVNGEDDQEEEDVDVEEEEEEEEDNVAGDDVEETEYDDDEDENVEVDQDEEDEEIEGYDDDGVADEDDEGVADEDDEGVADEDDDGDEEDVEDDDEEVGAADEEDELDEDDDAADSETETGGNDGDDDVQQDDDDDDDADDDDDEVTSSALPQVDSSTIDPPLSAEDNGASRGDIIDDDNDTNEEVHGFEDDDCDMEYETNERFDDSIFTSNRHDTSAGGGEVSLPKIDGAASSSVAATAADGELANSPQIGFQASSNTTVKKEFATNNNNNTTTNSDMIMVRIQRELELLDGGNGGNGGSSASSHIKLENKTTDPNRSTPTTTDSGGGGDSSVGGSSKGSSNSTVNDRNQVRNQNSSHVLNGGATPSQSFN